MPIKLAFPAMNRAGSSAPIQGSVDEGHPQAYLDEFVFPFNRRTSRSRGLVFQRVMELAVISDPVRYRDLVVDSRPKRNSPTGRAGWGHPPSLERPPATRPWRAADLDYAG